MVTTTDTYVQVGTKWELQNYARRNDVDAHRSPSTQGVDRTDDNGRTYPCKSNYFWQINMDIYNSRRDNYGSGDALFKISIAGQQDNTGATGANDAQSSWRKIEMNDSDHGDDADKELRWFRLGEGSELDSHSSTANIQSFCFGANSANWEVSNQDTKVHDALFIFHVMRSGADDGSANAPDVFKLMGNVSTNYTVGNGAGFINETANIGNISNATSDSIIMSPPSVPIYDYPDLTNGTIYEESGTGKHYMFNGTDTWNEMS